MLSAEGELKLCDFGSATTEQITPNVSWSAQQRDLLEDRVRQFCCFFFGKLGKEKTFFHSETPILIRKPLFLSENPHFCSETPILIRKPAFLLENPHFYSKTP